MPIYTVGAANTQDGNESGGVWVESGTSLFSDTSPLELIGVIFDGPAYLDAAPTLRLKIIGGQFLIVLQVFWADDVAPADYSTASLPGSRGALLVSNYLLLFEHLGTVVDIPLGVAFLFADKAPVDAQVALLLQRSRQPDWDGRIALEIRGVSLEVEASENAANDPPTLVTTESHPPKIYTASSTRRAITASNPFEC